MKNKEYIHSYNKNFINRIFILLIVVSIACEQNLKREG